MKSCVPQGSVNPPRKRELVGGLVPSSPLLFLCFSADLTDFVNTSTESMYAGHTKFFL